MSACVPSRFELAAVAAAVAWSSVAARRIATDAAGPWPPDPGRGPCAVTKQTDVPATMRDGTVLRADVYRPQTSDAVPVILMRTQYGKDGAQAGSRYQPPDWFASHCYLVVVQDIRGQGASGGTFSEFTHDQADGYDSVEWAAALPGSNGKVGMYGSSYVGATQWLAAVTAPPHLVTIVPANTASDYYDGWTYEGGEFRLAFVLPWAMESIATTAAKNRNDQATVHELAAAATDPTRWLDFRPFKDLPPMQPGNPAVAPWYFDWIRHSTRDDFWRQFSIRDRYPSVTVPVLHFEGWYDAFLAGGVENFAGMVAHGGNDDARANQRLVIGPWDHVDWGRPDSEPAPMLKAIGAVGEQPDQRADAGVVRPLPEGRQGATASAGKPRVDYFLMGANVWKTATGWPLPQTQPTTYYLSGRGWHRRPQGSAGRRAARRRGTRRLHLRPALPRAEPRRAFLLRRAVRPAGALRPDPGRTAIRRPGLQQRAVAARHRGHRTDDGRPVGPIIGSPTPISPPSWPSSSPTARSSTSTTGSCGRPSATRCRIRPRRRPTSRTQYQIQIWPTSYEFRAGDRIRLEISSSDYPQFAPNPNTGEPFGQSANTVVATQTILHDAAHPSSITLPVIPGG